MVVLVLVLATLPCPRPFRRPRFCWVALAALVLIISAGPSDCPDPMVWPLQRHEAGLGQAHRGRTRCATTFRLVSSCAQKHGFALARFCAPCSKDSSPKRVDRAPNHAG